MVEVQPNGQGRFKQFRCVVQDLRDGQGLLDALVEECLHWRHSSMAEGSRQWRTHLKHTASCQTTGLFKDSINTGY